MKNDTTLVYGNLHTPTVYIGEVGGSWKPVTLHGNIRRSSSTNCRELKKNLDLGGYSYFAFPKEFLRC